MKRVFAAMTVALVLVLSLQAQGITFTDGSGTSVHLKGRALRIVSLSPAVTEIIYAAGAGATLVGDTTYCNYPPEAVGKAKIGGYSAKTVSFEKVVSLTPDLVIGELRTHAALNAQITKAGPATALLKLTDFEDVYAAISLIGALAGDKTVADRAAASMKSRIEAVKAKAALTPREKRPLVFWETWDDPLMTAGPKTFTGMLIEVAGGRNCFADVSEDWPMVSFEEIVRRNPDVIMSSDSHGDKVTLERLGARPGWTGLSAVKSRRVVLLDGDIVSRPGPRLADAAELMAKALEVQKTGK